MPLLSKKLPRRIFLTGMMGSGKTTTGKLLASELGYRFVDTDDMVEEVHGPISRIFEEKGEEAFRRYESEVLQKVALLENVVISTGGGMPCYGDSSQVMRESGLIIYLHCSAQTLIQRLEADREHRPLISSGSLIKSIERLLNDRGECYSKADVIVNAGVLPEKVVEKIITLLSPDT